MRIKKRLLLGFCLLFAGLLGSIDHSSVQGRRPTARLRDLDNLKYSITKDTLQKHVAFLSSDLLAGRLTGSAGEQLATFYIAYIFKTLGLEPAGDNGSYFQEFNFYPNANRSQKPRRGCNVLARLKLGHDSDGFIIVGAHADHLGHGELGNSMALGDEQGRIHYGADDNASGVASILETARLLSDEHAKGSLKGSKDIIFAAWSGEEFGILGSSHFIKNFKKQATNRLAPKSIFAYVNVDMIGHLTDALIVQGVGSSQDWPKLIDDARHDAAILLLLQKDPYLPTDSTAFYVQGIPIINLFTGASSAYHTPRDTAASLNYAGIKKTTEFMLALINQLEMKQEKMTYNEVPKTDHKTEGGLKAYLGTIPDYASSESHGVKLAGVRKGSPAHRAGVRQNDVIIELGGKKIKTIYDYSHALNKIPIGKAVHLKVQRGGLQVHLKIIAQARY